jgi:hypothetical protein
MLCLHVLGYDSLDGSNCCCMIKVISFVIALSSKDVQSLLFLRLIVRTPQDLLSEPY